MDENVHYLSQKSLAELKNEATEIRDQKIPEIAKRIDEAKQQGDLSENAEYTQAREDMSWAQGRLLEIERILSNYEVIVPQQTGVVGLGSKIKVNINGGERIYTIVGPQEVDPAKGMISNESPLGEAFLGHKMGDKVEVRVPSGTMNYEIIEIL